MVRLHTLLPFAALLAAGSAPAQGDTTSIGGTEENAVYAERGEGPNEVVGINALQDVNDSLAYLPCYDLYCGWSTESIFPGASEQARNSDVSLQLSVSACDHAMPVCGAVNSMFGPRHGRMHYGVDLELETGDPVQAAFEGTVRISRYNRTFGNVVVIRHWNGLETLYAHLAERKVEAGETVEAGQLIGTGGSTGRSTGSHLHFETRYLGRPIDPKFIFDLEEGDLRSTTLTVHKGLFEASSVTKSYHIVRKGDTLSGIARRYGTDVRQLTRLNKVSTRSTLRLGQRIRYR